MKPGVYTALITPFNQDGTIDYGALRELVEFQIQEGITGLVPVGTTGESPTVSHEENLKIIEEVVKQAAGRVPIIAGTGSNCTQEAIDMTKRAKDIGADASLQVAPYYNKPNQEGFYKHFTSIADTCQLPIVIYNIPGRTGKNIETNTILKLASHPNIVAVKEASGNLSQIMDIIREAPADFTILSGDDNITYPFITLGGHGVISVASNLIPGTMTKFISAALAGDIKTAKAEHYRLLPLFKNLFIDTNPIPIKFAMSLLKNLNIRETYRLPLCPLSQEKKETVKNTLKELKII
ncbi:4-hydroxy-tetrahydrodipicolinate synthase [Spirochaetia bacterium 38H-sp]|uniref:4-hydroxy-tetrahydrodipicolinate synthase n=1 Tax=Rarispira pelagica TaxID=3141764 RepID=A0ABU9UEV8_9SPIR